MQSSGVGLWLRLIEAYRLSHDLLLPKHVLVDASWGRFLTLAAFGIICGAAAKQKGWRSSAVLYIFCKYNYHGGGFRDGVRIRFRGDDHD
jgi:hypothetical protein